jgi:hypothetical protein
MTLKSRPDLERAVQTAKGSDKAEERKAYAQKWVQQPGLHDLLLTFGIEPLGWFVGGSELKRILLWSLRNKNLVNDQFVDKMQPFFKGQPLPPNYYSLGAGAHGGLGLGMIGIEAGAIWNGNHFGRAPMRDPIADYRVEWATYGAATGFDFGVSVDMMAFTVWFGSISQINGLCNGVTLTGAYIGGLTVTLFWDGNWGGIKGTEHPIGLSLISSAGIEIGGGIFLNASETYFFNKRPNVPNDD